MQGNIAIASRFLALLIVSTSFTYGESSANLTPEITTRNFNEKIKRSLVFVRISTVYFDHRKPWIREPGRRFTAIGMVVEGNRILVLANDVRNGSLIEVRKHSTYRSAIAEVSRLDMETNTALLKVKDPNFFKDLKPLNWGEDPVPGQTVTAVKVDGIFRVYKEKTNITAVSILSDFGFTLLPVSVFRTSEPFQKGGILLCDQKVCGFIGYAGNDKKTEAIPPSTLNTFRKRAAEKSYSGFVAQGFEMTGLVDPVLREYYKLPDKLNGPLVKRVLKGTSSWGILQKEDVILSINGVNLDDRGYYKDEKFGRQKAYLLFVKKKSSEIWKPGESIVITVFRKGRKQKLGMPLRAYKGGAERIEYIILNQPHYIVESGFIFLELSVPYLRKRFGSQWRKASVELSHLYNTKRFYEGHGKKRIVILGSVLPDRVNRGYEGWRDLPIMEINGQKILNLREMYQRIKSLKEAGVKILALSLPDNRKIYLDLETRDITNKRVMRRYKIAKASTWD